MSEKYLDLAEKVLTETQSELTAQQIWNYAHLKGYTAGFRLSAKPWLSLVYYLKKETDFKRNADESEKRFSCIPGKESTALSAHHTQKAIW